MVEPWRREGGEEKEGAAKKKAIAFFFWVTLVAKKIRSAMSQESNDDQCAECDTGGELQCCDGCTNSFHASCLRPVLGDGMDTPHWFGYPGVPWFSEGCRWQDGERCCVIELKKRQQSVDEHDQDTRTIVRNVLTSRQRQVLRVMDGPFDEETVISNLSKTFGVYFSYTSSDDPTDQLVLVARMRVDRGQNEIRNDAWFANNTISEVHGLTTYIHPLGDDIMDIIEHKVQTEGGEMYSTWIRMLNKAKKAIPHQSITEKTPDGRDQVIKMEELRIVPQFDHTDLAHVKLTDGKATQCMCNKEGISNVLFRKVGRFCWVTGQTCNSYTEISAMPADPAADSEGWAEEIKLKLNTAMDKGFVVNCPLSEEDGMEPDPFYDGEEDDDVGRDSDYMPSQELSNHEDEDDSDDSDEDDEDDSDEDEDDDDPETVPTDDDSEDDDDDDLDVFEPPARRRRTA